MSDARRNRLQIWQSPKEGALHGLQKEGGGRFRVPTYSRFGAYPHKPAPDSFGKLKKVSEPLKSMKNSKTSSLDPKP